MPVSSIPETVNGTDPTSFRSTRNQIQNDFSILQSCLQTNELSEARNAFMILQDLVSGNQPDQTQSQTGSPDSWSSCSSTDPIATDLNVFSKTLQPGDPMSVQAFLSSLEAGSRQAVRAAFDHFLESVTSEIRGLLKAERATLFLVDRENGHLLSCIAHGADGESIDIQIPLTTGIAGRVASTGEEMNVSDPYNHPDFNAEVDRSMGFVTKSIICLPMFDQRQSVFAVIQLINKVGAEGFSPADKVTLRNLAAPLGVILQIWTRLKI